MGYACIPAYARIAAWMSIHGHHVLSLDSEVSSPFSGFIASYSVLEIIWMKKHNLVRSVSRLEGYDKLGKVLDTKDSLR